MSLSPIFENNEEYNRKIEELKPFLPILEKMQKMDATVIRSTPMMAEKINVMIEVIMGTKFISLDLLKKCEESLVKLSNILNSNENKEKYQKKIDELKVFLPILYKMYATINRTNPNEGTKIKALICVLTGKKRISLDILLKCEQSLHDLNEKCTKNRNRALLI